MDKKTKRKREEQDLCQRPCPLNPLIGPLEELVCSICSELLWIPLRTKCNHAFCSSCIREWLRTSPTCPLDKSHVEAKDLTELDGFVLRLIGNVQVSCPHKHCGCPWIGPYSGAESHVSTTCKFETISCLFCETKMKRGEELEHRDTCLDRPSLKCSHCSLLLSKRELEDHKQRCTKRPEKCCECGITMPMCDLNGHKATTCALALVACEFAEHGCAATFPRVQENEHAHKNVVQHLSLLSKAIHKKKKKKEQKKKEQKVPTSFSMDPKLMQTFGSEAGADPVFVFPHKDRVYVSNRTGNSVEAFTREGKPLWKSSGSFDEPEGIACTDDYVYVADSMNHRIAVLSHDGEVKHYIGVDTLVVPLGLALYDGELFVSDNRICKVHVFSATEGKLLRSFGSRGDAAGELFSPCGLAVYGDEVWVCDKDNARLSVFSRQGEFLRSVGVSRDRVANHQTPSAYGIAILEELVIVSELASCQVRVLRKSDGRQLFTLNHKFGKPCGLALDGSTLFVADRVGGNVSVWSGGLPPPKPPALLITD